MENLNSEKNKIKFLFVDRQRGAAMFIAVLFFLFISLAIIFGLVSPSVREFRNANIALNSKQSYFLAESGSEDAFYRLLKSKNISGTEVITLGSNTVTTVITTLIGNKKDISSSADVSSYQRKSNLVLNSGIGVSFNYGVQIGAGGLSMAQNSKVTGNVYSNGDIIGTGGGVVVTETAIVSGATGKIDNITVNGDATAHFLEDITVGGNSNSFSLLRATVTGDAVSDSINTCTVNGNATYDTKVGCAVTGSETTPNPTEFTDPAVQAFPIPAQQITDWKNQALVGGTHGGNYVVGAGAPDSLGPKKVTGNLTIGQNANFTITGTIWVEGNIDIAKDANIILDPSYGDDSEVLLSDGTVDFSKDVVVQRAGPNSYLMVLSTSNSSTAIQIAKDVDALIAYAEFGTVVIAKNTSIREVTAYRLEIAKDSEVIYEAGLADLNFSSGPSGGFSVSTWKEVQ